MIATPSASLLDTIVAATRASVACRERQRPLDAADVHRRPNGEGFREALTACAPPRIIAECKRRSPSRGILRSSYDPAAHARAYEHAGAAAISVLTEPTFFDGDPGHLVAVRDAVSIPILRKDFIVTDYQVLEAAALGADAVLLIVGALDDDDLRTLHAAADSLGLAALVEVHDEEELDRALAAGARIVGVNSRDLRTLAVDLAVTDRLSSRIPEPVVAVAESGIRSADDMRRLADRGYDAFLIGERLIVEPDPGAALRALRSA